MCKCKNCVYTKKHGTYMPCYNNAPLNPMPPSSVGGSNLFEGMGL